MNQSGKILLAHGGGGQLTNELIAQVILPAIGGQDASSLEDAATIEIPDAGKIVFTTDSYTVEPIEFPGGDIGKLGVCGTINDLAVCGARPIAISLALVLEEGFEINLLKRILTSAGKSAEKAGVSIVTGDTKVIERQGDTAGITVNTAGIGLPLRQARVGFERIETGDAIIISGPIGQHGMAVIAQREGLEIDITGSLISDCAAIHSLTIKLIESFGAKVKWMRDPTRGGLSATLAELAAATGRNIEIRESEIPVDPTALAVAEMLGFDLLSVANEGKVVAVVSADVADEAVKLLRKDTLASKANVIGEIGKADDPPLVQLLTRSGGKRIIQMPYGQDLPRIC